MNPLTKTLILAGLALLAAGLLLHFFPKLPFRPGRLPGDIEIRGKHGSFYFPLATCLLLSVLFSLLTHLFRKR
ncbi:MAG: DUF2905 domain-containing protein [Candidatus Solibacter sp.]|nr:DUF2905 domain-containing protein [Candidatus Solibacter sp.]